jgi:hypothetical protein
MTNPLLCGDLSTQSDCAWIARGDISTISVARTLVRCVIMRRRCYRESKIRTLWHLDVRAIVAVWINPMLAGYIYERCSSSRTLVSVCRKKLQLSRPPRSSRVVSWNQSLDLPLDQIAVEDRLVAPAFPTVKARSRHDPNSSSGRFRNDECASARTSTIHCSVSR